MRAYDRPLIKSNNSFPLMARDRSFSFRKQSLRLRVYREKFSFDVSSLEDSIHLFKRGSSCRDAVDRNKKALFARAHIRSVRPSPTRRAAAY